MPEAAEDCEALPVLEPVPEALADPERVSAGEAEGEGGLLALGEALLSWEALARGLGGLEAVEEGLGVTASEGVAGAVGGADSEGGWGEAL